MQTAATQISDEVRDLDLERYVLELETDGLTVVPPEVTGVGPAFFDRCTEVLLAKFTAMTGGCPISLETGPERELSWPAPKNPSRVNFVPKDAPPPTQMLIQQLLQLDRSLPRSLREPRRRCPDRPPDRTRLVQQRQDATPIEHQLLREVAGRVRLRPEPRPALRPRRQPAAVGQPRAHRQRHLVPDRLHARRRGTRLRPRLAPLQRPPRPELPRGRQARRVRARFGDRLARLDLARGVPRKRPRGCASTPSPTTATRPCCRRRT